jgi:serine O-acetyltransferase
MQHREEILPSHEQRAKPLAVIIPLSTLNTCETPAQAQECSQPTEIWSILRTEARDLCDREPVMRHQLASQILERDSAHQLVIEVVAGRLASAGQPAPKLAAFLYEALHSHIDEFEANCVADLTAVKTRDPACRSYLHILLNLKGFQTLVTYRAARQLWLDERWEAAQWLASMASLVFGADIHPGARLGTGLLLDHATGLVIGETAVVEDGVSILQNVTLGGTGKERGDRHPKVRKGVMIGAGANVLGNIEVGTMSKVAAGSVVLEPVPPHCTVAGVPARVVRRLSTTDCPADDMNQNI